MRDSLAACALAALAGVSCAKRDKIPLEEPVGETRTTSATPPTQTTQDAKDSAVMVLVSLTSRIKQRCDLRNAPSDMPWIFDAELGELRPRGPDLLQAVGECFRGPELEETRLCITAYTDPRSAPAAEETLGLAHADAVRSYLDRLGVDLDRTDAALRPDEAAFGRESQKISRRLEIDIQNSVPCPGRL